MVKVNILGFGFDADRCGGGITVFGVRVGKGPNGAELGVNVGLGVEADNHGLYFGAQAGLAVGDNGIAAQAGASATVGDERAQVAGMAATDGYHIADELHREESNLRDWNQRLEKAVSQLNTATTQLVQQEYRCKDAQARLSKLSEKKVLFGKGLAFAENARVACENGRLQEELKFETAELEMEFMRELGDVNESELAALVATTEGKDRVLARFDKQIKNRRAKSKQLEKALLDAQSDVVNQNKELQKRIKEKDMASANKVQCESGKRQAEQKVSETQVKVRRQQDEVKDKIYHMS